MIDRPPRPRAGATIVLLALLQLGCVGTNPDWDDARDRDSSTGSSPVDAASGSGSEGAPDWSTGPAAPSSDTGETGDTCLQQGLARCEDDTMAVCVDLSSNPSHCGACFHGCDAIVGTTCIEGQCRCEGGEWWAVCDGACREVKDDPHACGIGCIDCTALDDDEAECKNGICRGEGKADD
jgi:hypothetical protein